MSSQAARWIGQIVLYAAFAAAIAVLSQWPEYRPLAADQALLKVSFLHHGQRLLITQPRISRSRALSPREAVAWWRSPPFLRD